MMVSVIIINHDRKDLLKACLDSVIDHGLADAEIIVVDNASSDGSIGMIKTDYPEVTLISNYENLLFSKACNQGILESKGEFILCLNNDVILGKGYIEEALSSMNKDPRIGMVSGKILRTDKKTIDSTGLFLGRNRKAVERGYGKKDNGQYERPGYVFGASGACAFFRRSMLDGLKDKKGYFDETFGMYYEDLDLCWRAQKKGWKAYYNPKAMAYHARGATASGQCKKPAPLFFCIPKGLRMKYIRNRHRCMMKNDTISGILRNLPFILLYEIKIIIASVLANDK